MSVHATSAIWKLATAQGSARLVLLRLADQANDDGWCWPSHQRLAADCRLSLASVKRALIDLEEARELDCWRRGRRRTNVYRVLVGTPATADAPAHLELVTAQSEPSPTAQIEPSPGEGDSSTMDQVTAHSYDPLSVIEPSLGERTSKPVLSPADQPCQRALCDRGADHPGPHRDAWFDAVAGALYPGEGIPAHQASRAAKLARRAERAGHPPERILEAAAWIAETWGPEKLTLGSLMEHYERASGALAQLTSDDRDAYQAATRDRQRRARMAAAHGGASVVALPTRKGTP